MLTRPSRPATEEHLAALAANHRADYVVSELRAFSHNGALAAQWIHHSQPEVLILSETFDVVDHLSTLEEVVVRFRQDPLLIPGTRTCMHGGRCAVRLAPDVIERLHEAGS